MVSSWGRRKAKAVFETAGTDCVLGPHGKAGQAATSATIIPRVPAAEPRRVCGPATGVRVSEVPSVSNPPLAKPVNLVIKHLFEIPLTLVAFVISLPVMAFVALTIKLTSPGPVIHRRRVTGRGGVQFDAFKFRTMVPDAEDWIRKDPSLRSEFNAKYKLARDPRVTRTGQVLRRFSLDELPQLVNVLKGQMCLIGPRMISPEEVTKYGPFAGRLLTVKPGLTGLWQVSGRQTTTYDRRIELDMQYIDNWSLALDLAILARTPLAVLRGRGAL
jgi:lipopolysaccharide/colanic/teichoic acid biosynthesis glycosyltransferase